MIDIIRSRYKKLKTREKILVILFSVAIAASMYHRFLYKPLAGDISTYGFQIQKLSTRLDELNTQYPKIDSLKGKIELAARANEAIVKRITDVEKNVPSVKDASRLTAELTRLASSLELASVQQKIDKGDLYSRIYIELKFSAPFNVIVDYTDRIEAVSPFLKVEELSISEPTGKSKGPGSQATLLVSSLLMETPSSNLPLGEGMKEGETSKGTVSEIRDIFASKAKPVVTAAAKERRKIDFKLQGITYNAFSPTAIINDNVVNVGSVIDGYKVKEILLNSVTLADETEELLLTIEE